EMTDFFEYLQGAEKGGQCLVVAPAILFGDAEDQPSDPLELPDLHLPAEVARGHEVRKRLVVVPEQGVDGARLQEVTALQGAIAELPGEFESLLDVVEGLGELPDPLVGAGATPERFPLQSRLAGAAGEA